MLEAARAGNTNTHTHRVNSRWTYVTYVKIWLLGLYVSWVAFVFALLFLSFWFQCVLTVLKAVGVTTSGKWWWSQQLKDGLASNSLWPVRLFAWRGTGTIEELTYCWRSKCICQWSMESMGHWENSLCWVVVPLLMADELDRFLAWSQQLIVQDDRWWWWSMGSSLQRCSLLIISSSVVNAFWMRGYWMWCYYFWMILIMITINHCSFFQGFNREIAALTTMCIAVW